MRQTHQPHRDDDVAVWIKKWRNYFLRGTPAWTALDNLLNDYRLHADVGQPLHVEVTEGGHEYE